MTSLRRNAILGVSLVLASSGLAQAGPTDIMTRQEIIARAAGAVGYSYWWGGSCWRLDGTQRGTCTGRCPQCSHTGSYGSDCSGLVTKAWELGAHDNVEICETNRQYNAASFTRRSTYWHMISRQRETLRPGDVLSNGTHVVIFDSIGTGGRYWVYECRGCNYRCAYNQRTFGMSYRAARRNNIREAAPCSPGECSGHGRLDRGACECYPGYAGVDCDECAEGYTGYPVCHEEASSCAAADEIRCGDTVSGSTSGAGSWDAYGGDCAGWTETGPEKIYAFMPGRGGLARPALESDEQADLDLFILPGTCDPDACIDYGDAGTDFAYQAGETNYLVVDSHSGNEGSFTLTLECEAGDGPWVGDPCHRPESCEFTDPRPPNASGFCYSWQEASFCSVACTGICSDPYSEKAETFCIEDPGSPGRGICVSKAEDRNNCCTDIPGTVPVYLQRFGDASKTAWVCMPEVQP